MKALLFLLGIASGWLLALAASLYLASRAARSNPYGRIIDTLGGRL